MKRALITGIAGFAGSHLSEHLLSEKISVYGFYHPRHSTGNLATIKNKIALIDCDLQDKKRVQEQIKLIEPDYVFHLAAFSSPADSFLRPQKTLMNNILSQLNLLQSLVKVKSKARILIVGSADEYGNIKKEDLPAKEDTPLSPLSPYAVSKVAQDLLGLQFFLHHNLHIVRVRPFNHIGPRQSPNFVVSAFASQIAKLEQNGGGRIKVGDLTSWRDLTDVRDMVRAYFLALAKCLPGEVYNIGSGKAVKIADVLKMLLSTTSSKIKVKQEKKLLRRGDIKIIYCDYSKFAKITGWQPKIPLMMTLSDTIDYERNKL